MSSYRYQLFRPPPQDSGDHPAEEGSDSSGSGGVTDIEIEGNQSQVDYEDEELSGNEWVPADKYRYTGMGLV